MKEHIITPDKEQKTVALNKHPEVANQPPIDEVSLPEKLRHLSKHPHTSPWQNLHTETQAQSESTNTKC